MSLKVILCHGMSLAVLAELGAFWPCGLDILVADTHVTKCWQIAVLVQSCAFSIDPVALDEVRVC